MCNFAARYCLFLLTFIIAGSAAMAQDDLQVLRQKIRSIRLEMVEAQIAGDLEVGWSFYTSDIVAMPNYEEMIRGKKAYQVKELEWKQAGIKFHALNHTITDLWTSGDMVIEVGNFGVSMTLPNFSRPLSDRGKYMTVWQRQPDGSLKMKIDIWNTDVFPLGSDN